MGTPRKSVLWQPFAGPPGTVSIDQNSPLASPEPKPTQTSSYRKSNPILKTKIIIKKTQSTTTLASHWLMALSFLSSSYLEDPSADGSSKILNLTCYFRYQYSPNKPQPRSKQDLLCSTLSEGLFIPSVTLSNLRTWLTWEKKYTISTW